MKTLITTLAVLASFSAVANATPTATGQSTTVTWDDGTTFYETKYYDSEGEIIADVLRETKPDGEVTFTGNRYQ